MGLPAHPVLIRNDVDLLGMKRIADLADRLAVDIVHAHTSRAHLAAVAARHFARCRPRCVVHRRIDFSIHKLPLRLSGLKYRWEVDRYVAVTQAVKDVLADDGIPPDKIAVIHSGTDLSRFDHLPPQPALRQELGIPDRARVVGNVGFLVGHKGHEYLLEAAAQTLKEFPDAFFVIIGEGPMREGIQAQARTLGIEGRLSLPGFRNDVPHCLAQFEIFCLSSWGEGIGGVVIEAMAANVPVVTTNAGGLDEVVKDDRNGVIVPVRQSRALADGVRRLLREPETARRLARAARRTVEQNFTVGHMVEKTLALYEDLLA